MKNRERRLGTCRAIVASAAFVLGLVPDAGAQELSHIPAAFVDVGVGTREMGMGGAAVAGCSGPSAIFWNPAGLAASESNVAVLLTYGNQMGLVPYSAASGSKRLNDTWVVGAGLIYSGDDALSEMTLLLAGAADLGTPPWTNSGRILAGASVRARRASFGNNESAGLQVTGSATGASLDAGAIVPLSVHARAAVSMRDVAGALRWDTSSSGAYDEAVPPVVVFGVAVDLGTYLVAEVDLDKALHLDGRDLVSVGCEASLFGITSLRAGYRRALSPDELEEFSVGGGASVAVGCREATLDLAYVFGELENTLRLGLTFDFGRRDAGDATNAGRPAAP